MAFFCTVNTDEHVMFLDLLTILNHDVCGVFGSLNPSRIPDTSSLAQSKGFFAVASRLPDGTHSRQACSFGSAGSLWQPEPKACVLCDSSLLCKLLWEWSLLEPVQGLVGKPQWGWCQMGLRATWMAARDLKMSEFLWTHPFGGHFPKQGWPLRMTFH